MPVLKLKLDVREDSRIDRLVLEALRKNRAHFPRSEMKALFRDQRVSIGGRIQSASDPLRPGTYEVSIQSQDLREFQQDALPSPQGCFLPIVYEDKDLLVLDKESGIPSAPQSPEETETAVGAALAHYPSLKSIGFRPLEPGLLHRLDTGTSGLLAFAKTEASFRRLREAWKIGRVQKTYRALAHCKDGSAEALLSSLPKTLSLPLAHDLHSKKKMIVILPSRSGHRFRGKPLSTRTHITQARSISDGTWDFEVQIETGVMHQIRCTLAFLGCPILGDPIYSGEPSERLWLHAWRLKIPRSTKPDLVLETPLPTRWPLPA